MTKVRESIHLDSKCRRKHTTVSSKLFPEKNAYLKPTLQLSDFFTKKRSYFPRFCVAPYLPFHIFSIPFRKMTINHINVNIIFHIGIYVHVYAVSFALDRNIVEQFEKRNNSSDLKTQKLFPRNYCSIITKLEIIP